MMYALKGLCVIGMILNVVLVLSQNKKNLQTEEGKENWEYGRKYWIYNSVVGFVANFLDTLGIGSFATSSAAFKFAKSVRDVHIPGTLNVGDTFPVCLEAFLFFGFVEVETVTLLLMLAAAIVGSIIGARFVNNLNAQGVRLAMGIGLFLLGIVMALRQLGVGPFGVSGDALALTGAKLVIGVVVNFILGGLMCIGVGLYAPCIALVSVLGMNIGAAFPIMMGSCAFLMAFGNGPQFVKANRYDMVATLCQMGAGAIGVLVAYFLVKSMPLNVLFWVVLVVVFITSIMFFRDYAKGKNA
ncbi:MAG TPA: TSUP family transporter [Mogibacterium sp.]|nr:TSUP family transporter [Mogibacterium sp.]